MTLPVFEVLVGDGVFNYYFSCVAYIGFVGFMAGLLVRVLTRR